MPGVLTEGETSIGTKRKEPPTEPTANEDRNVRSCLSTPSGEPHLTVNYEDQLAYKYKVLLHLPPELDFFKETLQDILNLSVGVQDLDSTLVQDILNRLSDYGADVGKVAAARLILQTSADKTALKQIGSRTRTTQDLKDGIRAMVDAFVSSHAGTTCFNRENFYTLLSEDSGQHKKSGVLADVTDPTAGAGPTRHETPYSKVASAEASEAKKLSELQDRPEHQCERSTNKRYGTDLHKESAAPYQDTQPPADHTEHNSVADSLASTTAKDQSLVSPKPDEVVSSSLLNTTLKQKHPGQAEDYSPKSGVLKVKGAAEVQEEAEGKDTQQGLETTATLAKQRPKLITKDSLDQLIAEERNNVKNDHKQSGNGGLPTPQSTHLISNQSQNSIFTTLERELYSCNAPETPMKTHSTYETRPKDFPPMKSLQIDRKTDNSAPTHHTSSLRVGSKNMTCYFWYNRGFCNKRDEDCTYQHRLCEYIADPRGGPRPTPVKIPGERRSLESRIERPFQFAEEDSPGSSNQQLHSDERTIIVNTLWAGDRPVTIADRHEIVETVIENILRRGSPSEFVTDVQDLMNPGKRLNFDLRQNAKMFMTKLGGIFSSKDVGTYRLRLMLENALKPFVYANKQKFPDVFEQAGLRDTTPRDERNAPRRQSGDFYRPVEEQSRRESTPAIQPKVEEQENKEVPPRAKSLVSSPGTNQAGAGTKGCRNCGDVRHRIEDCWKGVHCSFCKKPGHPTEVCKFRTGEWKYQPRP